MSIDPDQSDTLTLPAIEFSHARHSTRGHRVVTPETKWNFPGLKRLEHKLGMLGARGGDLFQILRVRIAFFFLLGNSDGNVAAVFDFMPDYLQTCFQSCHTNGGRAHIDAAARLAEIEGNTNDANLAARGTG